MEQKLTLQILKRLTNGARSVSALAEEIGLNRHYLTGALLLLEERGLIQLVRGKDGRISGVILTEKGMKILQGYQEQKSEITVIKN